eukprot:jgi/Astpho2/1330/Aster-06200
MLRTLALLALPLPASIIACAVQRSLAVHASTLPHHLLGCPAGPDYRAVQRNLALELVRVTEAAALAGGKWFGKGDKNAADQAPMLYCGEHIGNGTLEPKVDIAVDPLDGTTSIAMGRNGAVCVIALAERGALFDPGPCMYMEKLAVGPAVPPSSVSLENSTADNIKAVSKALRKPVDDVTVLILDRPRHADIIKEVREAGARIKLISDGDVGGAIEVAKAGAAVDMMLGIGGTPEGVIAAAALRCMGGTLLGRLWPRSDEERQKAEQAGYELTKQLTTEDLCKGEQVFFAATGVSDGDLLRGVRYFSGGASSNSIVMRTGSGTVRVIETTHQWSRPSITNPPAAGIFVPDTQSVPGHFEFKTAARR